MDKVTLVETDKEDGQKLLSELAKHDFPVTAAAWVKTETDGRWYLYIATPLEAKRGPHDGYSHIISVIPRIPQPFWLKSYDVKLISPEDPIARDSLEMLRQYPGDRPIPYGGDYFGRQSVEGAYIYPPTAASSSARSRN
jgi:hypothetical protein